MDSTDEPLPPEIIAQVFSHLAEAREICVGASVCQTWREAASMPHIWKQLAVRKYGRVVAETTVNLYGGDWREMLKDDNRKGALPTLKSPLFWTYRFPRVNYFFAGIVVSIKWHRILEEVRVYIEARGERDLRHPSGSTVLRDINYAGISRQSLLKGEWRPDPTPASHTPGHFKGCLVFPQQAFMFAGDYTFCYANTNHEFGDYSTVPLLHMASSGLEGLEMAFLEPDNEGHRKMVYSLDVSPFANDTEEQERARWDSSFPDAYLDLFEELCHRGWWV